jgi:GrpB-like predicted nucleotidyltransferase (UPF0157 family)
MRVLVEPYNPIWAQQFQAVKRELVKALDGVDFVSIEHVGSTSVPGLAAKPILDVDIIVRPATLESTIKALTEKGGYSYLGEWGIQDRHVFRRAAEFPARNLYVCIEGCQSLQNHLLVRDICRREASVREAYGRKKMELALRDWADVDEYCEAKNEILQYVLERAGMGEHDLEEIRLRNVAATR